MEKETKEILNKLEGYLKFKNISKKKLAELWKKNDAYIYRRFSGIVELTLQDIRDLCKILQLTKEEAIDIFFYNKLT